MLSPTSTASRSGCSSCCLDHIQSELVLSVLQCLASAVYVYVCVYLASERLIAMQVLTFDVGEVSAEGLFECFSLKGVCLWSY